LQSTLVPEGDTARAIAGLFWFFTAVWLMVMTLLLIAVVRKRTAMPDPRIKSDGARERRIGFVLAGGIAAP
jgi:cytochrome c-type biogenesis protein CcmH/NrfF